jgi:hypothetical protein
MRAVHEELQDRGPDTLIALGVDKKEAMIGSRLIIDTFYGIQIGLVVNDDEDGPAKDLTRNCGNIGTGSLSSAPAGGDDFPPPANRRGRRCGWKVSASLFDASIHRVPDAVERGGRQLSGRKPARHTMNLRPPGSRAPAATIDHKPGCVAETLKPPNSTVDPSAAQATVSWKK